LIGKAATLAARELLSDCLRAACPEPEEQRILEQQSALDVVLLDVVDETVDAPNRGLPDLCGCLDAVAAHQLMQFQLTVGREKASAAARGAATDDILLDQYDAQSLAKKFGGRTDTAESAPDDEHVALDRLRKGWAILVFLDQQGGDPPNLIDHPHTTNRPGHPLHLTETACGIVAPFAPFALHAQRNAIGRALIGAIRLSVGHLVTPPPARR
jgi:hypothetical protein